MLAYKVAITLEACHASELIEQAFARFGVPEIVNTDLGNQGGFNRSTHSDHRRREQLCTSSTRTQSLYLSG